MPARLKHAVAVGVLALALGAADARAAQRGGSVRVVAGPDADSLDPGLARSPLALAVAAATQRGLYAVLPGQDGPVADLAVGPPEISADHRTITVHIRDDVRFAPPVGRPVVAADVQYAIDRVFSRSVDNRDAQRTFAALAGAPRGGRLPRTPRAVAGVQAPDAHTLVLVLRKPAAVAVAAALTSPVTAPVPPEVARAADAKARSTYGSVAVATGPYRVAGHRPGRSILLARNPTWDAATDLRPAYLDAILISEGHHDAGAAARQVLNGAGLLSGADGVPAATVRRNRDVRPGQLLSIAAPTTRFVALNTRVRPFTSRAVRRAVLAGLDRRALLATRGGAVAGSVATHFLPPPAAGFAEAGGAAGAKVAYLAEPSGNRRLAAALFRRAGFPAGRYTGRAPVLVVGPSSGLGRATTTSAARQLRRLGFRVTLRLVPPAQVDARWCGVRARRVAVCPDASWTAPASEPEGLLRPPFDGSALAATGNANRSFLDDRTLNRLMGGAALVDPGPDRLAAWAAVDRRIVADAPAAPYAWDTAWGAQSANVDGVLNPGTLTWDYAYTSLRP